MSDWGLPRSAGVCEGYIISGHVGGVRVEGRVLVIVTSGTQGDNRGASGVRKCAHGSVSRLGGVARQRAGAPSIRHRRSGSHFDRLRRACIRSRPEWMSVGVSCAPCIARHVQRVTLACSILARLCVMRLTS